MKRIAVPPALAGPVLTPVVGLNRGNPKGENQDPGFRISLMTRMIGIGVVSIRKMSVTGIPLLIEAFYMLA